MDLSVLIPTYRRPEGIERCLCELAKHGSDAPFEVIVGLDGDRAETPDPSIPETLAARTRFVCPGRVGLPILRGEMLSAAAGNIVLWLNDDAYPQPGLLRAHLQAHNESGRPRVVAGRARWFPVEHPTLFDRVVQQSDLVFFRQPEDEEIRETDYRNCFGLNMSFPRVLALEAGGVACVEEHYGYEDIEIAWRLHRAGAQCVYHPGALVLHDHRYGPRDVHRREYLLGRAARAFAARNSAFSSELFGIDLNDNHVLEGFRHAIELGWRDALRIERSFLGLEAIGPDAADDALLPLLAEHWVLLKRLLWRWGVLDAHHGIPGRWSLLSETAQERVLCNAPDPV